MPELEQLELEHISHKLLTLYKASHLQQLLSRPAAEILAKLPLLEVQVPRPVLPKRDGDAPAVIDARIPLASSRRRRLHKSEMLLAVTRQHTLIRLVQLGHALFSQKSLHVHTEVGVGVPTLQVGVQYLFHYFTVLNCPLALAR